jgi:hypothetical protein
MKRWGIDNMATAFFQPIVLRRDTAKQEHPSVPFTRPAQPDGAPG